MPIPFTAKAYHEMIDGLSPLERAQFRMTRMIEAWNSSQQPPTAHAVGEYKHLLDLLKRHGLSTGYCVDLAASNGIDGSCTYGLFKDGWDGICFEMDGTLFSSLSFCYADLPNVKLLRSKVLPSNVGMILSGLQAPLDFDFLNLDIDSYDLFVLEGMLNSGFKPKIVSMEVNPNIPPPVYFTVLYNEFHFWNYDHFFGCSLTAANDLMTRHGYILDSLEYCNAFFVQRDFAGDKAEAISEKAAFLSGYLAKEDRKTVFSHTAELEPVLSMSPEEVVLFYDQLFTEYKGMYILRNSELTV